MTLARGGEVGWTRTQRGHPLIGARFVLWCWEGRQGKGAQMRAAGSFGSEQMKEHLSAGSCFLRIKQDGHLRLR